MVMQILESRKLIIFQEMNNFVQDMMSKILMKNFFNMRIIHSTHKYMDLISTSVKRIQKIAYVT